MILCEMDSFPDFPDSDECLKYHVKDKTPVFENCEEKQGVQCIIGK